MNNFITKQFPHIAAALLFLALSAAYFSPQLSGKVVQQGDIIQYLGMSQEVRTFEQQSGERSLWTNAMFGGMPTYQINTVRDGNHLTLIDRLATLSIPEPIGRFFAAMLGFYILMICLGVNPWLGLAGAVAFGFSTNNLILFEAGHITKVNTISYFPFVAAGVLLAFRQQYAWGGLLFALGVGLNILSNHVQMTYYFFLTLLFFGVAQLIYSIRQGELVPFAKAAAVLMVGGLVGIASAASNLLVTYEYSRDTMRGKPILEAQTDAGSSAVEGLAWDYAMQWSNGTLDLFASFIPGVVGGGSQEPLSAESATAKDLRARGANPAMLRDLKLPLYWGELPFTSGPAYFGATVIFFFLLGLIVVKGPVKWWLALGTLLTLLLSMGKNLEWFNEPFFNYFPLYNKFRTPNSILSVTAFLLPMLGILALHEVFHSDAQHKKMQVAVYLAAGIAGAIALFFWLIGPSMFDFNSLGDARLTQAGFNLDTIRADRKALMRSDAFRSLVLVLLCAGLVWAYTQKWLQRVVVIAGIGVLVLFDLWSVGKRYLNENSFVNKTNIEANFRPRQVDELILKDREPGYRVLDLTTNTFNSSAASYFHRSIGGYHAAKLQRYQDIIDRHLSKNNERVLNMLNTRYYIVPGQNQQPDVELNIGALGAAWFVTATRTVPTPDTEIDALSDFNPENETIIHEEFSEYLSDLKLQKDSLGTIKLSDYKPNHLTYTYEAQNEQLVVFSEIWYGPDKGWQAYIDGQPAEHIRANYILRAMRVPAGKHTIEFRFDPPTFRRGKLISNIFSSLLLLGLLGMAIYGGYQTMQQMKKQVPQPQAPQTTTPPAKPNAKPATSKRKKKK
ncbi:MAG TPA: YfhO family protein [Saprospiraceae bacterium]|nr:YfhO family protein [Saprospiraceae bacterium]HMP14781.1 YfhO family protein [Saprospiraceae bacterium]